MASLLQKTISQKATSRAGPSRCGAQRKRGAGPLSQLCYDVIVLNRACYDLFDEDVLAK